jgi:hypothetical protein
VLESYVVVGRRIARTRRWFRSVSVGPSQCVLGQLGVFTTKAVVKGQWLTEYGGKIISPREATVLVDSGQGTHLRCIDSGYSCYDGRIRGSYTLDYYVENHLVGSLINAARLPERPNARFVRWVRTEAYSTPMSKIQPGVEGQQTMTRVLIQASKDILPYTELLVSYGPNYPAVYF